MKKNSNTLGPILFFLAHGYWGWTAAKFFDARLFIRIYSPRSGLLLSAEESRRLLLILVLAGGIVGFLLSAARRRNHWSLFLNVLSPYGIYLVLAVMPERAALVRAVLLGGAVFTAAYAALLIALPVKGRRGGAAAVWRRLGRFAMSLRTLSAALLCALVLAASAGAMLGLPFADAERNRGAAHTSGASCSLSEFKTELSGLKDDRWSALTLSEKTALMQLVANIETGYLGLPEGPQVRCEALETDTLGSYNHKTRTIRINQDYLLHGAGEDCVRTILHEVYHSYQYSLCDVYEAMDSRYQDLYFLRSAADYAYEFQHYHDGGGEYSDYYEQACEVDARAYAENRAKAYLLQLSDGT